MSAIAVPRLCSTRHWASAAGIHQAAFTHAWQEHTAENDGDAHVLHTSLPVTKLCTAYSVICHCENRRPTFRTR